MQQHIAIIKREEVGINEVLDRKCMEIDSHITGREKTAKILE